MYVQTTRYVKYVGGRDANTLWAVGVGGVILKTTNGGNAWSAQTATIPQNLYGIWLVGGAGYIVGNTGVILYASPAALPVTLVYFNGRMTTAGALLGWATAGEDNNARLQIERSRDRHRTGGLAAPASPSRLWPSYQPGPLMKIR